MCRIIFLKLKEFISRIYLKYLHGKKYLANYSYISNKAVNIVMNLNGGARGMKGSGKSKTYQADKDCGLCSYYQNNHNTNTYVHFEEKRKLRCY